jgi:cysteinyl-tRNA synthetase
MNDIPLFLTNTLTGTKEVFKPLHNKTVTMYVCGITPYDFAHLGHARVYIIFDVLYRLLTFLGYKVMYCRNITDIDDKLLARAEKLYGDQMAYTRVADQYIKAFQEDMRMLACLPPTYEPRVTDNIADIIEFIQALIANKKAYVADGDVYFDVAQAPSYGKLSKQNLKELHAGARVEINPKKRSPLDFALWKSEPEGSFWSSPWGYGRPGWHIECSALAFKFLGKTIDIHAGGADLIFPHHENEIAQTEGRTGQMFARVWLHNAFVQINKEKMSKSLGNFFTIRELLKTVDPMVLRFLMLNHHYRAPIDFALDDIMSLKRAYQRLCVLFDQTPCPRLDKKIVLQSPLVIQMLEMVCDDLNTVGALGIVFKHAKQLAEDEQQRCAVKQFMQEVFGLSLQPLSEEEVQITSEIQQLLDERERARQQKDWKRADELRAKLVALGVQIHDTKQKN